MVWTERLNKAVQYLEENLTSEIDIATAAKICHCSSFHFQRMFSYIAGVPLAEYIRRRRMTKAIVDLQRGDKIIDIALRYGYSSPTAFNRAFHGVHGVAPSRIKGALLKSYPPISFKLTVQGVEEMEFKIVQKGPIRVLGVPAPISSDMETSYYEGEAHWVKVLFEGAPTDEHGDPLDIGPLCKELNAACETTDYNGFFSIQVEQEQGNTYMIAVESTKPESENLKEYVIPAHTWAVFPRANFFAEDNADLGNATKFEERLYSEWLPNSGYELADGLDIAFTFATEDLVNMPYERWLPVRKI